MAASFCIRPIDRLKETAENHRFALKATALAAVAALAAAASAAGRVDTLKNGGRFTVFAATNAAFDKLPAGTFENLLLPENRDQPVSSLTYHVVPGAVIFDQLAGKRLSVATVQGSKVHVDGTDGVTVDGATVTAADIIATNGVIHVIDEVILLLGMVQAGASHRGRLPLWSASHHSGRRL